MKDNDTRILFWKGEVNMDMHLPKPAPRSLMIDCDHMERQTELEMRLTTTGRQKARIYGGK